MTIPIILTSLIITLAVFIISALPLHLAVKTLGGKTNILKTALIVFITAIIAAAIQYMFETLGGLLAFVILIWIYHEAFRLKWFKAFFAWLLQFAFIALFYFVATVLLGLTAGFSALAFFF